MSRPAPFLCHRADKQEFRRRLQRWFKRNGRDLPWRRMNDPYAILVSEFMLQQTQVATVLPFYRRWLERFPDFAALARATEEEVLHAWQGLGYYGRARNLHAAARRVMQEHGGELPNESAAIARLPGVGRYTAGALASFAFGRSAPIVEANIARVIARLTNCRIPIDTSAGQTHLWAAATELLPLRRSSAHNSALMDLGALVCLPRQPRCHVCPVRAYCRAERPETLPRKKKRPRTLRLTECHAFTRERDRLLLEQSQKRWRGMWILPRLARAPSDPPLFSLEFPFTHHRITLAIFAPGRPALPNDNQRWFPLRAVDQLPVPAPHRRALAQLLPAMEHVGRQN